MSKKTELLDQRVDAFVAAVNSSPRGPLPVEEIPEPCKLSQSEAPDWFDWQIVRSTSTEWLTDLERRLPFRLPPTFRSLIARYLFPSFEVGPLTLYSVGVSDPDSTEMELKLAIFADSHISPFLLRNRLLPFARPADWSYDPVCFDLRNPSRKSEPPVLRIDHEEILCNNRLRVVELVSPRFHELIEDITRQLRSKAAVDS